MEIREFIYQEHKGLLEEWLKDRSHYIPGPEEYPAIGCIAYDKDLPVAVAFLRRVEGGFGMVDGLTSNPEASSEQRHLGLDLVIYHILSVGKASGIMHICSITQDENTLMRAIRHGFVKFPHAVVMIDLNTRDFSVPRSS